MSELFVWLMITLMAGFGGIVIGSALCEARTTKIPGRRIPGKGVNL